MLPSVLFFICVYMSIKNLNLKNEFELMMMETVCDELSEKNIYIQRQAIS